MRRRQSHRSTRRPETGEQADDAARHLDVGVDEVVIVPRRGDPPPKSPFPLLSSLAPLGVAVVVWFVLHSPLALVFAVLSPVMAVASLVDGRFNARKASRRNDVEVARRRQVFRERVDYLHARELDALGQRAPSARSILARPVNPFTATAAGQPTVSLGFGAVRSGIRVEGGGAEDDDAARRLRAEALLLKRAPVLAPAPARIAVVGKWPLVHALARGYAVQLAAAISPDAVVFVSDMSSTNGRIDDWEWARSLPHSGAEGVLLGPLDESRRPLSSTFVVVAPSLAEVPAEASVVITVDSASRVTVLRHPRLATPFPLEGEFVSVVEADALRETLTRQALASTRARYELPSRVSSAELEALAANAGADPTLDSRAGLAAAIGVADNGDIFTLDLVEHGPHAVVAGTTGSGKSELLVTWVAALARAYDADTFTVLLVDFKGGAAFDPLTALEQCVGLITDLDPSGAERALSSLRAEIRRRETLLRESGARDVSDRRVLGRLPRLMIVVDEFAAMLTEFPQLHDVFADIAARGRSLGLHLVLCTQRPAGIVRDSLLANCEIRLSLRVNNAADSTAIIGSPAASLLSPEHRGRCLVSFGGRSPVTVQVAHTDTSGVVGRSASPGSHVTAPWLPPLPNEIALDDMAKPPTGYALGLLDLPDEQRQPPAVYIPEEHGSLLILGSSRSGKSTVLATIALQASAAITVGPGIEDAWDAIRDLVSVCRSRQADGGPNAPMVVLIDDLDSLLRRFEPEYQAELTSDLVTVLRDGPAYGISLVVTAQRLVAPLTALAPFFPERIHLRFASRQEYIVAEGVASNHDPRLPPGAGHWRGTRIHMAVPPSPTSSKAIVRSVRDRSDSVDPLPRVLLLVAARPAHYLDRAGGMVPQGVRLIDVSDRSAIKEFSPSTDERVWLVGTPDAWITASATFAALRGNVAVYFDGCSLSDFRALTRRRELPPPVDRGRRARWLLTPDGVLTRFDLSEDSVRHAVETRRIS